MMPLGPTEVVQYHQPTALDALTKFMGDRAQRQSDDQEAQDKLTQHSADQKQQVLLHMISQMDPATLRAFVLANKAGHPEFANIEIPENHASMAEQDLQDILSRGRNDINSLRPEEKLAYYTAHGMKGGDVFARILGSQAYGGDPAGTQTAAVEGGLAQSADQQVRTAETNRHNITGETQLAPVRRAETFRDTQQGNASRESATNQAQLRDVNSPRVQTEINKATAIVRGESTIPNRPKAAGATSAPNFTDATQPDFKEHPALKDYNSRLRKLAEAHDAIAGGAGKLTPDQRKQKLDDITGQIVKIKATRQTVANQLNVPVTAQDALSNPRFKKATAPPTPSAPPPPPATAPVTHKEYRPGMGWVVVTAPPPPSGPVSQNMNTPDLGESDVADTEDTGGDYAAG